MRKVEPDKNINPQLKAIEHFIDFEIDPNFTTLEKSILRGSMRKLEIEKINLDIAANQTSNDLFKPNISSLQITAESLAFKPEELAALRDARKEVIQHLTLEEQKQNQLVADIMSDKKDPAARKYTRKELATLIRARAEAGNSILHKEKKQGKAEQASSSVSQQGVFGKRHPDVSPRSIHESAANEHNTDKKRTRRK